MKKIITAFFFLCTSFLSSSLYNHYGPPFCALAYNTFDHEGAKIGATYKLKLISSGLPEIARAPSEREFAWALLFTSLEKMELKECQKLAQELTAKLLDVIYKDPCFDNYLKESAKQYKRPPEKLSDKRVAFRINFWDENVERRLYPYIAEIRLVEETIYYYYADPKTQGLQEIPTLTEPFSRPSL